MNTPARLRILIAAACLVAASIGGLIWLHAAASANGVEPYLFVQSPRHIDDFLISRDGRVIVTSDHAAKMVTFRDARTGSVLNEWPSAGGFIRESDDERMVIETCGSEYWDSVTPDDHFFLRDAASGRIIRSGRGHVLYARGDFSLMIVGDVSTETHHLYSQLAQMWAQVEHVTTGVVVGKPFLVTAKFDDFEEVGIAKGGGILSIGFSDRPAQLLSLPSMTPIIRNLPPLASLEVMADDRRALGARHDNSIAIWNLSSGRQTVYSTRLTHVSDCYEMANGDIAVVGFPPNGSEVTQVRSADGSRVLYTVQDNPITYGVRCRTFLCDNSDGIDAVDEDSGARLVHLDATCDPAGNHCDGYFNESLQALISPDRKHVVTALSNGLLRFYDLSQATPAAPALPISTEEGATVYLRDDGQQSFNTAAVLPGGGIAISEEETVVLVRPGQPDRQFTVPVGILDYLSVSPDGKVLAGFGQWGVWQMPLPNGNPIYTPQTRMSGAYGYSGKPTGLPFWPDGSDGRMALLTESNSDTGGVRLARWSSDSTLVGTRPVIPDKLKQGGREYDATSAVASPNGATVAVNWEATNTRAVKGKPSELPAGGMLQLYDARTGTVIHTLVDWRNPPVPSGSDPDPSPNTSDPVFSPDGRLVAVIGDEGQIWVWDTSTGELAARMTDLPPIPPSGEGENEDEYVRLAFSSNDKVLAVGRLDGSIYLYSMKTMLPVAQVGTMSTHFSPHWMQFSDDGSKLYGANQYNGTVVAWDVPSVAR